MTYNEAVDLIIKQNPKELKELKKQYSKLSKSELVGLYGQRVSRVNSADTLPKSELIGVFVNQDIQKKHRLDIQKLRNNDNSTSRGIGSTSTSGTGK